jgi:hypothetical protein
MSASLGAASAGSRPELISATFLRLRRLGFDGAESANLIALRDGLAICSRPWTVGELTHLRFLRESRSSARRWSHADDRADRAEPTPVPALARPAAAAPGAAPSPAGSTDRARTDRPDGAVTLLTLLRSMAGPNATLEMLRPAVPRRLDAADDTSREGG